MIFQTATDEEFWTFDFYINKNYKDAESAENWTSSPSFYTKFSKFIVTLSLNLQ